MTPLQEQIARLERYILENRAAQRQAYPRPSMQETRPPEPVGQRLWRELDEVAAILQAPRLSWRQRANALQRQATLYGLLGGQLWVLRGERPKGFAIPVDRVCGARTRQGTSCQRRDLYGHTGRCKFHGGWSTGPRTSEGKRRSAMNGVRPKRKRSS
ncbi:MAG: HGGxSTG domain-containing protein [Candidatus Tectimicrobiota bacterium]